MRVQRPATAATKAAKANLAVFGWDKWPHFHGDLEGLSSGKLTELSENGQF